MQYRPSLDQLEPRALTTLVFVLNGNAFAAAEPGRVTQIVAADLARSGNHAIQMSTPSMDRPGSFMNLASQLKRLSKGQPIGLVGFSAGGTMAMRLAQTPGLNVKAVLNFYGPPDLRSWFDQHRGDRAYRYLSSHVHLTSGFINQMSGPSSSRAYTVSAFGIRDSTVTAAASAARFHQDFPDGVLYYYAGAHGVTISSCYPAYLDFLCHL